MDFVVGIKVQLSNNHNCKGVPAGRFYDICDELQGRYPKDFKFTGWHPLCRCYATPVLMSNEEFAESLLSERNGEKAPRSANEVTALPDNFKEWVERNKERIEAASDRGTLPYFIRDNHTAVDNILNPKPKGLATLERAKMRHEARTAEQIADIKKRWEERKNSKLDSIVDLLVEKKIAYNAVTELPKPLPSSEIVSKISGGDKTTGSCASVALAYAGNRCGLDVLDFRGGDSQEIFAQTKTLSAIAQNVGGSVVKNKNDFASAAELLKQVETGKEYFFTCGKHAAIIRKKDTKGFEYLELQSSKSNGFKALTTSELKSRFGAQKTHTISGVEVMRTHCLIEVELLKKDAQFRKILGYINTAKGNQKKGASGGKK